GAKERGCRRHCLCVLSTGQLWVLQSVRRRRQEGKKPVQLVGNRRERRSRPRGPRRAVLTAEETAPEPIDASACEACSLGELLGVRVQAIRDHSHRCGGLTAKVVLLAGRPEEHDRANPGAGGEGPAFE